jgi:hypothetical protein
VRRIDPTIGEQQLRQHFEALLPILESMAAFPQAVDFLRRMVIEDFMAAFINNSPQEFISLPWRTLGASSTQLCGGGTRRPVHISEICQALHVTKSASRLR